MARKLFISLIFFLFSLLSAEPTESDSQSSPSSTIYDVLVSHGLPIGIFPKGVFNFTLDPASGNFQLNLLSPAPCAAKFETAVRYECDIKGTIAYGQIANLSGLAAQELFLWLPVKSIRVDVPSSGLIYFDVGVVFKQFSLSFFETPKDCNVLEKGDGGNSIVLFDYSRRIVENQSGGFVRKHFGDYARRAVA
ncbi:unnamed protein product [Fraxinus pennsylvanica]|uniref:Uncharacterized protein n=1 Tax=Fraxinus pennsylvanica TaxID=56036 RepID=A0AAD1YY70_9LAMI|nr:unnamed protein product [Fraxinus pennsylvanica]